MKKKLLSCCSFGIAGLSVLYMVFSLLDSRYYAHWDDFEIASQAAKTVQTIVTVLPYVLLGLTALAGGAVGVFVLQKRSGKIIRILCVILAVLTVLTPAERIIGNDLLSSEY